MRYEKLICVLVLLFLVYCPRLSAKPVSAEKSQQVVMGWLKADARPLGASLGQNLKKTDTFSDEQGQAIYYVVYLQPSGFVVVPADDLVEPILAFTDHGTYNPSLDNPLGALVNKDVRGRIAAGRELLATQGLQTQTLQETTSKWDRLAAGAQQPTGPGTLSLPSVSDPRVDPLLKTKWAQTICCNEPNIACYNYYTPPSDPWDPCDYAVDPIFGSPNPYGDPTNFPSGCVATAMAQLMRFLEHPQAGVGKVQRWITVNGIGNGEWAWTRGGDGQGGPYYWDRMVYEPNCDTNKLFRQAIGALCYDAGVSVKMNYTPNASWAFLSDVNTAFIDVFKYSNAVFKTAPTPPNPMPTVALEKMINPNLDYEHPVLVGFPGDYYGHAVVVDGYGYNLATIYHHINMGWAGVQDAWYNFYNDMPAGYNSVDGCVYNTFESGAGEIISGRVTDTSGKPLAGATVTAVRTGGGIYQAVTNDRGIYALAPLPSASTYTIRVTNPRYNFSKVVTTGTSKHNGPIGNQWGADFTIPVCYVDTSASGANNGSSWDNAYNYIQDALANPCAVIFVADGTYKPDRGGGHVIGDRTASFILLKDVAIYGGFAGYGAPDPNARDVELYETILTGDLAGNDVYVNDPCNLLADPCRTENSFHVVVGSNTDGNTVLDGFTITAGNASGVSPDCFGGGMFNIDANCIVNNCKFVENSADGAGAMWNGGGNLHISNCIFFRNAANGAGGILNYNLSNPTLVNCRFISNKTCNPEKLSGALANMQKSRPFVVNCEFINNSALNNGAAISNLDDSSPTIINCTFKGNLSSASVGGILDSNNCHPTISNCILWDNTAPQIYDDLSSAATINYSDVQGGWAGTGNIDADPLFVNADGWDGVIGTLDDNLRLLSDSPCVDAGDNTIFANDTADLDADSNTTEPTPLDLDNRPRYADGDCNGTVIVDMGAYEFAYPYAGDFDGDCNVEFLDFAILANSWFQNDPLRDITPPPAGDGIVDIKDLAVLCDNWLAGK
jgi:hypothetical protein